MSDSGGHGLARLSDKWAGVVQAYLEEVRQRTGSEKTVSEYRRVLLGSSRNAGFLALVPRPDAATPAHVHAYAYGRGPSGREPSPSTVMVRLAALAGFFDFGRRMGLVKSNPAGDVKRPKKRQPAAKGLSREELAALLEAVPDSPSGRRDRAVILTAVLAGLRRSELFNLTAGSLSRNGAVFYCVRVKGGETRRRELPAPAFEAIVEALEADGRKLAELEPAATLFNVSPAGFYANLRRYARKAGLEGVTIHALRHTAAKLRRDTGASLEDVSSFLGHRDLAVTARYLKRLEGEADTGWRAVAAVLGVS